MPIVFTDQAAGDTLIVAASPSLHTASYTNGTFTFIMNINSIASADAFSWIVEKGIDFGFHLLQFGSNLFFRRERVTERVDYIMPDFLQGNGFHFMAWIFDLSASANAFMTVWSASATDIDIVDRSGDFATTQDGSGALDDDSSSDITFANKSGFQLADFALWNRVLPVHEIRQQYRLGLHPTPGCVTCVDVGVPPHGLGIQPDRSGFHNHARPAGTLELVPDPITMRRFKKRRYVRARVPDVGGLSIPVAMHHYTKNILAGAR